MGKHDRCCIGSCNNDKRYPDLVVKRGHVAVLKWHRFAAVPTKRLQWIKLVSHGRKNLTPGKWIYICSNHFIDGKPTNEHPNPTLFLNPSAQVCSSPVKRRKADRDFDDNVAESSGVSVEPADIPVEKLGESHLTFAQLTREHDVHFYTGFIKVGMFETLFEHLKFKASSMKYWDGVKRTRCSSYDERLNTLDDNPDILHLQYTV